VKGKVCKKEKRVSCGRSGPGSHRGTRKVSRGKKNKATAGKKSLRLKEKRPGFTKRARQRGEDAVKTGSSTLVCQKHRKGGSHGREDAPTTAGKKKQTPKTKPTKKKKGLRRRKA